MKSPHQVQKIYFRVQDLDKRGLPIVIRTILGLLLALDIGVQLAFADQINKAPAVVKSQFIYENAPFPQCHASTIVDTPTGLVAAWFGGTQEKSPDVGIWVSRLDGDAWSTPVEVANGIQHESLRWPCWNPVLHQANGGPLLLFYKVGPSPSTWWGMRTESKDGGITWSRPERLPDQILGPIKNKPIVLASGQLLCPTSEETSGSPSRWTVHFERTDDLGITWSRTQPLNDGVEIAAIQPSILQHTDGLLQAIGRSRQGKLFTIESNDDGKTWSEMSWLNLPNNNSGTDAITLKDGRHLVVYNHTTKGRSPLNVSVSKDGKTWEAALVLEDQPGEYSYPAVIESADGLVHITYTWKRQRVKHVVVDPEKLKTLPIVDGKWPFE
jgi:predicted neuraminidase